MLELLIDRKVIKLVHVLQEPEIVMKASHGLLFVGIHVLANVQKLIVNLMHIDVPAFALLSTELGLLERSTKDCLLEVLDIVFRLSDVVKVTDDALLLFALIFDLPDFVIKVLPSHIRVLLLISVPDGLVSFDQRKLFFLHSSLLLHKALNLFRPDFDHLREILDAILSHWPFFRVFLDDHHFIDNRFFENFD